MENFSNEIGVQEKELQKLKKSYAGFVVSGQESSEEAQRLADEIRKLSSELDDNQKILQEAEKAAENFGNALEDAGERAEDSGEGYTVLKGAIADLAADAIEKAIDSFKTLATEGDTALSKLAAKTGTTSSELQGFEDVMYEVYNANYGESLTDVSDKMSSVIQVMDDLDNASLSKVTKSAIALEDVFEFDVSESMLAVNSLMDQFGITSEQAFNLIVQGAQNGLNQNGDLLDVINEYSSQFTYAGYSAEQMFNMLANGAESGTWSVDKLGDALKEFNIRASDGTIAETIKENAKILGLTTKQAEKLGDAVGEGDVGAYNQLLQKLKEVEDWNDQYVLGVEMFGTMWEDLGEDAVFALMDTEGAIDGSIAAMEQLDAVAYDNLESSLSQLGRTVNAQVIQPLVKKFSPILKETIKGIDQHVKPAIDWFCKHLPKIGIAISAISAILAAVEWGTIAQKISKISTAFKGMATAIAGISTPVLITIGVLSLLALAFVDLWESNEEFRNNIIAIWDGIKEKFELFGGAITDRLNALGFDFEDFAEVAGAIWDGFCSVLSPVFEGAFQVISNVLGTVLDVLLGLFDIFTGIFTQDWDMAWQGIVGIFESVCEFVLDTFSTALGTLKNIADTILGWFGTDWETVWGNIKTFFVETWNEITTFFSDTWTSISTKCSEVWTGITTYFSETWGNISAKCSEVWENIKNTIGSKIESAKERVSNATGSIKTTAGNAWDSVSSAASSKWECIKNTIGSKIESAKERVSNAAGNIKTMAGNAWDSVSSAASSKWESIKNTIGSKIESAKERVSNAAGNIKTMAGNAWDSVSSAASSKWENIKNTISDKMNAAKTAVSNAIDKIKGFFNFNWSLPKLKLPHFEIKGKFSLDPLSAPKFSVSWYKDGGILTKPTVFGAFGNTLLAGGEAGAEAVVPLEVLWEKLQTFIQTVFSSISAKNISENVDETIGINRSLNVFDNSESDLVTATAGKLLALEDFSLGSLADNTNTMIYYDFSNFTWSPQVQMDGKNTDEDTFMEQLRMHEAEFFDWLEEFVKMREVAQYA